MKVLAFLAEHFWTVALGCTALAIAAIAALLRDRAADRRARDYQKAAGAADTAAAHSLGREEAALEEADREARTRKSPQSAIDEARRQLEEAAHKFPPKAPVLLLGLLLALSPGPFAQTTSPVAGADRPEARACSGGLPDLSGLIDALAGSVDVDRKTAAAVIISYEKLLAGACADFASSTREIADLRTALDERLGRLRATEGALVLARDRVEDLEEELRRDKRGPLGFGVSLCGGLEPVIEADRLGWAPAAVVGLSWGYRFKGGW